MDTANPLFTPTARQAELLDFIVQRCLDGSPPTIREIGLHFGIKSPNGVVCHMKALANKMLIDWDAGKSRAIRPSEPVIDVQPQADGRLKVRTTGPVIVTADDLRRLTEPLRMAA